MLSPWFCAGSAIAAVSEGSSLVATRGLLTVAASLVAEHRPSYRDVPDISNFTD